MDLEADDDLATALQALGSLTRLQLLHRLEQPAFMPDLAREFRVTRQALKKHLDALEAVDLVVGQRSRRRGLPATKYAANPTGLFRFKEQVMGLAVSTDPASLPPLATATATSSGSVPAPEGAGFLLVHGDARGRWFPLRMAGPAIVGRDRKADVSLSYDPYASSRHAVVQRVGRGWAATDLHSTNGTRVNFQPLEIGAAVPLHHGDLLTVGRSHLLLRDPRRDP